MVLRSSSSRLPVVVGLVAIQIVSIRHGYGLPTFLVCVMVAIVILGTREKWDGEVSAYSVFNEDGRRLPGQFTAEQFDAQLRGHAPPEESVTRRRGHVLSSGTTLKRNDDPEARRRLLAAAAERRFSSSSNQEE